MGQNGLGIGAAVVLAHVGWRLCACSIGDVTMAMSGLGGLPQQQETDH
jgi:hypothetical protein